MYILALTPVAGEAKQAISALAVNSVTASFTL